VGVRLIGEVEQFAVDQVALLDGELADLMYPS
jgi:hypothetical protein